MAVGVAGTSTPTPGNQTWGELKSSIANSVGMGAQEKVLGLAGKGINNAVRYLNTRVWSWLLTTQDVTLVADTIDYTLSDNFKAARSAELLDSSSNPQSRIFWEDPKTFGDTWLDRGTSGTPRSYTVFSFYDTSNLTLNVPPSSNYATTYPTLRLRYYKSMLTYSGDGTSQSIPPEVELFIEYFARWELAQVFRPELISTAERMWKSAEVSLLRSESHSQVRDFT